MDTHNAADCIADAVADLRRGRHRDPYDFMVEGADRVLAEAIPVDVTAIHHDIVGRGDPMDIYGESVMRPPWANALLCYHVRPVDRDVVYMTNLTFLDRPEMVDTPRWESTSGTHRIDWDLVQWVFLATLFVWRRDIGVVGPIHAWRGAVHEHGDMADLYNMPLSDEVDDEWSRNALLSMLKAVTFLNCRNVTLVEPARSRAQRRRFERAGVRLSEIHVFPSGTTVRGHSMPVGSGTPLHSVRGHLARYGPQWGRGLLFGKIAGEFWIPQHARGAAEHGATKQTVTLEVAP